MTPKLNHPKPAPQPLATPRCPACGHPLQLVYVHGHGQCRTCHTNIEPCCSGAPCPTPKLS